jgi:hypothetical protein
VAPKKTLDPSKPEYRLVIDYRELNKITQKDKFPIPLISEILDQLGKAKYFTTLDLAITRLKLTKVIFKKLLLLQTEIYMNYNA